MNTQQTLLGLFLTILLVVSSAGVPINETDANATTTNNFTTSITTLTTQISTSNFTQTTQTTAVPITTANVTNPTTSPTNSSTAPTTATKPITSATTNSTVPTKSSTKPIPPSPKSPGRRFDGLSFVGGIILAVGLSALLYLVLSYTRRNSSQLPYSNLR